jgi:ComF family protein
VRAHAEPKYHNGIVSIFSYQSPEIRTALWSLKYKNNKRVARILAAVLHDTIFEDISEGKNFAPASTSLLIPIPLHKKRQKQRGYNQSELLCKELSLIDPVSFIYRSDVLYRNTDTLSQTTLKNKKARAENVRGCFEVKDPKEIKGKHIVLIDDITTTGATIKEAMKVLRKAGAKKVTAYTVAH